MKFLFVCTGNTCRSPMAEAVMKEKFPEKDVKSAGIFAMPKDQANVNAITVLQEKNITIQHEARMVSDNLLSWADVVLTMTTAHKQLLLERFPQYEEKYYTLIEYVRGEAEKTSFDIADPFGGDVNRYRETLNELEMYIDLIDKKDE